MTTYQENDVIEAVVADDGEPLRIAIISEGCYPFHTGGVSLWCDQLIRGMPRHAFTAVALTVDGTERPTWAAPANLAEVVTMPLWGRRPRRARRRPAGFPEVHEAFLRSFLPYTDRTPDAMSDALRRLFDLAQTSDVGAALVSNDSVTRLVRAVQDCGEGPISLRDAVIATDLLEHSLRPLSFPPIRADVVPPGDERAERVGGHGGQVDVRDTAADVRARRLPARALPRRARRTTGVAGQGGDAELPPRARGRRLPGLRHAHPALRLQPAVAAAQRRRRESHVDDVQRDRPRGVPGRAGRTRRAARSCSSAGSTR